MFGEETFDTHGAIEWAREHADVPIFAICVYLAIIFYVPDLMKDREPFNLRQVWSFWNLLLSVFSILGASRTLPHLALHLYKHGFIYTVCQEPESWYLRDSCGLWVTLFIFSKVPELMDTVFLVFQKKPVIFLHWFHHVTVLLYCWHAFISGTAPGLWFATVNYCVHSIMYFYYFMSISGGAFRTYARPLAPFITTFQLLQMVVGMGVTASSAWQHSKDPSSCTVNPMNYRLGLAMYSSYFVLFASLYYNLYLAKDGKHRRKGGDKGKGKEESSDTDGGDSPSDPKMEKQMCGVDLKEGDAAGFFHPSPSRVSKGGKTKNKD